MHLTLAPHLPPFTTTRSTFTVARKAVGCFLSWVGRFSTWVTTPKHVFNKWSLGVSIFRAQVTLFRLKVTSCRPQVNTFRLRNVLTASRNTLTAERNTSTPSRNKLTAGRNLVTRFMPLLTGSYKAAYATLCLVLILSYSTIPIY